VCFAWPREAKLAQETLETTNRSRRNSVNLYVKTSLSIFSQMLIWICRFDHIQQTINLTVSYILQAIASMNGASVA
jgi:hypothetical protein